MAKPCPAGPWMAATNVGRRGGRGGAEPRRDCTHCCTVDVRTPPGVITAAFFIMYAVYMSRSKLGVSTAGLRRSFHNHVCARYAYAHIRNHLAAGKSRNHGWTHAAPFCEEIKNQALLSSETQTTSAPGAKVTHPIHADDAVVYRALLLLYSYKQLLLIYVLYNII